MLTVTEGLEGSGASNTRRPLDSSKYSVTPSTEVTSLTPAGRVTGKVRAEAGKASAAAKSTMANAEIREVDKPRARRFKNRSMSCSINKTSAMHVWITQAGIGSIQWFIIPLRWLLVPGSELAVRLCCVCVERVRREWL